MFISEILKDSEYKLNQFSNDYIEDLENKIIVKNEKNKTNYYVNCIKRNKDKLVTEKNL